MEQSHSRDRNRAAIALTHVDVYDRRGGAPGGAGAVQQEVPLECAQSRVASQKHRRCEVTDDDPDLHRLREHRLAHRSTPADRFVLAYCKPSSGLEPLTPLFTIGGLTPSV